ncbi:MAG: hypothetical protein B6229_06220 [Spirochaetaceae bacterium 4572_7]|nr:MAG: hypothetical protein B6229_06220 [Spirochaetaceae bacterium 4572_7]
MNNSNVAVILVNWNNYHDTIACLNSIKSLDYNNFSVFVVDNGSQNNSYSELENYSQAHNSFPLSILRSDENLGFAGGNNFAVNYIRNDNIDYYWFLNNDTEVDKNSLSCLVEKAQSIKNIGAVGSKILTYSTNNIGSVGGVIDYHSGQGGSLGQTQDDVGQYDSISDVDYVSGCSLLVPVNICKLVGLMDDSYFLYYEDTDWSLRIRATGARTVQANDSIIYHKAGQSSGGDYSAPFLLYYNIRNRFIMTKNNYSYFTKWGPLKYLFSRSSKLLVNVWLRKDRKIIRTKYILLAVLHALTGRLGRLKNHV